MKTIKKVSRIVEGWLCRDMDYGDTGECMVTFFLKEPYLSDLWDCWDDTKNLPNHPNLY